MRSSRGQYRLFGLLAVIYRVNAVPLKRSKRLVYSAFNYIGLGKLPGPGMLIVEIKTKGAC